MLLKCSNIVLRCNVHAVKCTNLRCTNWWHFTYAYFCAIVTQIKTQKTPPAWKALSCPLLLSTLHKIPIILTAIPTDSFASPSGSCKWDNAISTLFHRACSPECVLWALYIFLPVHLTCSFPLLFTILSANILSYDYPLHYWWALGSFQFGALQYFKLYWNEHYFMYILVDICTHFCLVYT